MSFKLDLLSQRSDIEKGFQRRIRKPQIFFKVKVDRMICFKYIPAKKKKKKLDKIIVILCILQFTKVKKARTLK